MSNSLHPYSYRESDGQYYFDTPSGARYVAYFLDLSSLAENLFTFNFDRIIDGAPDSVDCNVFDTICAILHSFFLKHQNSMLLVCDTADGREEARMRLFNSWFLRIAPAGLTKIDRSGKAEAYNLFVVHCSAPPATFWGIFVAGGPQSSTTGHTTTAKRYTCFARYDRVSMLGMTG